jgi:hypothetical protein
MNMNIKNMKGNIPLVASLRFSSDFTLCTILLAAKYEIIKNIKATKKTNPIAGSLIEGYGRTKPKITPDIAPKRARI